MLYQVLAGEHPFAGLTPTNQLLKHLSEPLPPLLEKRPELTGEVDAVIRRATAKEPNRRYPDVLAFAAAFHQAISPVVSPAISPLVVPETINPYKGLRPFEEADAADFFGREALTEQLLTRLGEDVEASYDGTAKVWDAASGQELLTLSLHTGIVYVAYISPDGKRLVTSGYDGTVRVYALELEELVALARSRLTRPLTQEECRRYLHVEQCPGEP